MNRKILVAVTSLVLFTTACSDPAENPTSTKGTPSAATSSATSSANQEQVNSEVSTPETGNLNLVGTHWKLIILQDTEISAVQRTPYLRLDADSRLSGSDGCNDFMGSYTLTGDSLSFGDLGSTKMACPDQMKLAGTLTQALQNTRKFELHADQLALQDATGLQLARFQAVVAQ